MVVNAPPPPLSGAPSGITVPAVGVIGVPYTISWGAARGTVGYYVLYESDDPTFPSFPSRCTLRMPVVCTGNFSTYEGPGLSATGPSPTRSGLPRTLYYRVQACNASGCGPFTAGRIWCSGEIRSPIGWVEAALAHPCVSRHLGILPVAQRNPSDTTSWFVRRITG